jgi:general secretion pathway protein C
VITVDKLQNLQSADLMRLLQGAWVKQAVLAANVLLTIWIAWILAMLTWSVIDAPETVVELPAAAAPERAAAPDPDRQKIGHMKNWHLFGTVTRETQVVKPVARAEAPETRLKLVLRGAFASKDREIARAIIADPRGKEEQYALGDKLPGNAELTEVYPDKVILMRNGRYETLRLPDERSSAEGRSRDTSRRSGSNTTPTQTQSLKSMRQQLKQNPKSLYGLVRATPKKDEAGNLVGYTLQPGRDPELFQNMGLQEGDVVTGINDIKLDSVNSSKEALKSAEAGDSVTMTVLRNGQEETLTFSMPE